MGIHVKAHRRASDERRASDLLTGLHDRTHFEASFLSRCADSFLLHARWRSSPPWPVLLRRAARGSSFRTSAAFPSTPRLSRLSERTTSQGSSATELVPSPCSVVPSQISSGASSATWSVSTTPPSASRRSSASELSARRRSVGSREAQIFKHLHVRAWIHA